MLSLSISHVATAASPFCSSISFLKFVRFCSHEKRKTMKLGLSYKNVNISSHRKGNFVALTTVYQFE